MFSVCVMKHLLERGVIVIHILQEPLLAELREGQGLCEGLDMSLCEVVGLGLMTCAEEGFVRRPHLLVGGVHSVATILVEVEGQQELREIEGRMRRRGSWVEWRAQKSKSNAHFMHGEMSANTRTLEPRDVVCNE